jgi:chitinase
LDYINLLAYDLHGSWEAPSLAHHAPIFKTSKREASIDSLVSELLTYGFPARRVLLGMSTYGRSWHLLSPNDIKVNGPGVTGRLTKMPNLIAFFETCRLVKSTPNERSENLVFVNRSAEAKVPSVVAKREWIGYDDTLSFKAKVRAFK